MYNSGRLEVNEEEALGILKHLDKDELQQLLDEDSKLNGLITDLPQVKHFKGDKQMMVTNSKSIAEYNLSKEPRLRQAREQLARVYENAVEYQKSYEQAKQKLEYEVAKQNPDTTLALLQTKAAETEEEAEEILNQFLDSKVEVEKYLEEYIPKRTEAHVRKAKADKMAELLRERERGRTLANAGGSFSNNHVAPAANVMAPYPPVAGGPSWGAPYPAAQPMAMPSVAAYLPR